MHSIVDLLESADALRVLYELGYEPGDDNFVELTTEQYAALDARGEVAQGRWYRITRGIVEDRKNPPPELPIVSELQKERLLQAVKIVYAMSSNAVVEFSTFGQRLEWLRARLPPVITGGR